MSRVLMLGAIASLVGCTDDALGPPEGTFVGNPSLTARLADNAIQHAQGGVLDAFEVLLTDCVSADDDIRLGARVLVFEGAESESIIELQSGEHCGLWMVVYRFEVTYEEGGVATTVIGDNFDLSVPSGFFAEQDGQYRLRLGDEAWLADVAALAPPGETTVLNGTDPALDQAFYDGLTRGSTIEVSGNQARGDSPR